jgi:hypothetical protein
MRQATYKGYVIWGHAIKQQEEVLAPERYAASGTITRDRKFVDASRVLGVFDTEEEALDIGLSLAHGSTRTGTNEARCRRWDEGARGNDMCLPPARWLSCRRGAKRIENARHWDGERSAREPNL